MTRDIHDLLEAGAPRDPGTPDLDAIERRVSRRRTARTVAVAATLAAVVAVGAMLWPGGEPGPAPVIDDPTPSESPSTTPDGTAVATGLGPELDPLAMPVLPDVGMALEVGDAVVLLSVDGDVLGHLADAALARPQGLANDQRIGGPLLVTLDDAATEATGSSEIWIHPTTGDWVPASRGVPLSAAGLEQDGEEYVVAWPDVTPEEPLLRWSSNIDWWLSENHLVVTTGCAPDDPDCVPTFWDDDVGGQGELDPGCWVADKMGDFALLQVCQTDDGSYLLMTGPTDERTRLDPPADAEPDEGYRWAVYGPQGTLLAVRGRGCRTVTEIVPPGQPSPVAAVIAERGVQPLGFLGPDRLAVLVARDDSDPDTPTCGGELPVGLHVVDITDGTATHLYAPTGHASSGHVWSAWPTLDALTQEGE